MSRRDRILTEAEVEEVFNSANETEETKTKKKEISIELRSALLNFDLRLLDQSMELIVDDITEASVNPEKYPISFLDLALKTVLEAKG